MNQMGLELTEALAQGSGLNCKIIKEINSLQHDTIEHTYALEVTRSKTSIVDRTTTQTLIRKGRGRQRDSLCTRTNLPLNNIPDLLLMLDNFFVM